MTPQLGATIRQLRKAAGLTQAELAERCGWHPITIQQYERGVREPKLEKLLAIAKAVGRPITALVALDDPAHTQLANDELRVMGKLRRLDAKSRRIVEKVIDLCLEEESD